MSFYFYDQNNSGGEFDFDAKAGISVHVIVEADSPVDADIKARRIGLYFDGAGDCPCCGRRWYSQWKSDGTDVPMIYGREVAPGSRYVGRWVKWLGPDKPECFIHYADGRIEAAEL